MAARCSAATSSATRGLAGLTGRYLYGDLCRSDLRTLNLGAPGADPQPAGISIPSGDLRGFGEDSRGCVYVGDDRERLPGGAVAERRRRLPAAIHQSTGGRHRRHEGRLGVGLARRKHQRLRRYVTFKVTCSEVCALSANGALRIYSKIKVPPQACTAHDSRPGCPGDFQRASLPTGYAGTPVELHLKLKKGASGGQGRRGAAATGSRHS